VRVGGRFQAATVTLAQVTEAAGGAGGMAYWLVVMRLTYSTASHWWPVPRPQAGHRVPRVEGPGLLGSAQLAAWQLGGCVARSVFGPALVPAALLLVPSSALWYP
jgi:hypothetical protein